MYKTYNALIAINKEKINNVNKFAEYIENQFKQSYGDKQLMLCQDIFNVIKENFKYNDLQLLCDDTTRKLYNEYKNYLNLNYVIYMIYSIESESEYDLIINKYIKSNKDLIIINKYYK